MKMLYYLNKVIKHIKIQKAQNILKFHLIFLKENKQYKKKISVLKQKRTSKKENLLIIFIWEFHQKLGI
jgi:hypothetical protein